MITIKDGIVTIQAVSGSNFWAGNSYFRMTDNTGTKVNIHMSIIAHCLTILQKDTKYKTINQLLKDDNLWGK